MYIYIYIYRYTYVWLNITVHIHIYSYTCFICKWYICIYIYYIYRGLKRPKYSGGDSEVWVKHKKLHEANLEHQTAQDGFGSIWVRANTTISAMMCLDGTMVSGFLWLSGWRYHFWSLVEATGVWTTWSFRKLPELTETKTIQFQHVMIWC